MLKLSVVAVVVAAAAFFTGGNALILTTPTAVFQCQPILLTWFDGTPPYYLSLLPGGQPSGAPLHDFGVQTGTSLTWIVNYPAGTSLGLLLRDSTGTTAQTAPFTVLPSSDSSCLASSAGGSPTTTTSTSTRGTTGSTTPIFPFSATSESSSLPTITTSISPTALTQGAVSTGAVAGGVVGSLLFVGIVVVLIFYFCRRRPKLTRGSEVDESIPANIALSPHPRSLSPIYSDFRVNDANLPSSSRNMQPMNEASTSVTDGLGIRHNKDRELELRPILTPSNEQQGIAAVNPRQQQGSAQVQPRVALHQDSGVRFNGDRAGPVIDLPPLYTEG